jgi:uncharacterized protein with ParB-like and HNH nuclease domain
MKASQAKFSKLIGYQEKQFIIPIYQREYKWTKTNIERLINDLEEIDINEPNYNHFLNSIVYSKIEENPHASYIGSRVEKYHVIDGQQRLITISLLLIAIRNFLKELGRIGEAERINNQFLINQYVDDIELKTRLKLSEKDHDVYKKLVLDYDNLNLTQEIKQHKIYKNYKFFEKYIKENYPTFEELQILIQKFESRIDIIDTLLEKEDNPQKIFSSLNSTGVSLKDSDLVKNFLLMNLNTYQQKELYNEYWKNMENILMEENNLDAFLQHYLTMKLKYVVSKNSIYEAFEKLYLSMHEDDSYIKSKTILQEMQKYSLIYKKLFLNEVDFKYTYSSLNLLKIESHYPLLMYLENNYPDSVDEVSKIIENYLIKRVIVGLPPGKTKNVFVRVLKELDGNDIVNSIRNSLKAETKQYRIPLMSEVEEDIMIKPIYSNNTAATKYILYKIEYYINSKNYTNTVKYDNLTIEHILPETEYSNLPDCWQEQFSLEDYERLVHTLGNLTLITQQMNSSISNNCFEDKKDLYEKDTFNLTKNIAKKYDEWNEESIRQRGECLLGYIKEIWPDL